MNAKQERLVQELEITDKKWNPNYLNYKDEFCVSGVMCELAIHLGLELSKQVRKPDGAIVYGRDHCAAILPPEVSEFFGIKNDVEIYSLNSLGNFAEMAKKIREEPRRYFKNVRISKNQRTNQSDPAKTVGDEGTAASGNSVSDS